MPKTEAKTKAEAKTKEPLEIHEELLMRYTDGIATILNLDASTMKKYVLDLMSKCGATLDCQDHDFNELIERIYYTLMDSDSWNYGVYPGAMVYSYAAAVVVWMYLYSYRGIRITPDCQLFSDEVTDGVMHFLATYDASKIGAALKRIKHRTSLRYCLPP